MRKPHKRMHKYGIVFAVVSLLVTGCMSTTAVVPKDTIQATFSSSDQVVELMVADTAAERQNGLGPVEELPENTGMLFVFNNASPQTFWMKDVEYPIDIVWLNNNVVIGIEHSVLPEDPATPESEYSLYSSPRAVDMVVELPAGWAAQHGVVVGTKFVQ